jgi:hypothetical protein
MGGGLGRGRGKSLRSLFKFLEKFIYTFYNDRFTARNTNASLTSMLNRFSYTDSESI